MSAALRWLGTLLRDAADWLDRPAPAREPDAWTRDDDSHQRVFELRTRSHCVYY